eukprot:IDg19834t1
MERSREVLTDRQKRGYVLPKLFLVCLSCLLLILSVVRMQKESVEKLKERISPPSPFFPFEKATPESLSRRLPDSTEMRRTLEQLKRIVIDDYMVWHRATLRAVHDGRIRPESVRVIVFRGRNGMGDRIRGIIHAYFCAVISRRLLLIE